jgi:hypothetical protein
VYGNDVMPCPDDVVGVEENASTHLPIVPVRVEGPTRVQSLPSRLGSARNVKILPARSVSAHNGGDNTFRVNGDPRRRRCIVLSTDQTFYYGSVQEVVESGGGAIWPINVPLVIEHCEEFFLASTNAAGSTISLIIEDWSN